MSNVSVKLRHCRGNSLGVAKLDVDLDVKNVSNEFLNVLQVTAEVRAARSLETFEIPKSTYCVGHALLEHGVGQLNPGNETTWTLGIGLTPYQLQKIEEIRSSGDMYLIMRFMCTGAELDNTDSSKVKRLCSIGVEAGYSSSYCPFKIAQSDWIKILGELGYGEYFLIEVPLRDIRGRKQMEKALLHLNEAWVHYMNGNDRETLASCYTAFEFLAKQAKAKNPDQNAFERLLGGIGNHDMKEKLKFPNGSYLSFPADRQTRTGAGACTCGAQRFRVRFNPQPSSPRLFSQE